VRGLRQLHLLRRTELTAWRPNWGIVTCGRECINISLKLLQLLSRCFTRGDNAHKLFEFDICGCLHGKHLDNRVWTGGRRWEGDDLR